MAKRSRWPAGKRRKPAIDARLYDIDPRKWVKGSNKSPADPHDPRQMLADVISSTYGSVKFPDLEWLAFRTAHTETLTLAMQLGVVSQSRFISDCGTAPSKESFRLNGMTAIFDGSLPFYVNMQFIPVVEMVYVLNCLILEPAWLYRCYGRFDIVIKTPNTYDVKQVSLPVDVRCITPHRLSRIQSEVHRVLVAEGFSADTAKLIAEFIRDSVVKQERSLGVKILQEPAPRNRWPQSRAGDETIIEYIRRVYGEVIKDFGFTQGDLRRIERSAYNALHNYCRHHKLDSQTILPTGITRVRDVIAEASRAGNEITYENAEAAWERDPTPENYRRMRAYKSLHRKRLTTPKG